MSNRNEVYGWHILPLNKKLRYGDDRKVRLNEPLSVEGTLKMCYLGLHASKTIGDALHWWKQICDYKLDKPCYLTVVRLSCERLNGSPRVCGDPPQKWCARTRTVLGMAKLPNAILNARLYSTAEKLAKRVGAVLRKDLSILRIESERPRRKKNASAGAEHHRSEAR